MPSKLALVMGIVASSTLFGAPTLARAEDSEAQNSRSEEFRMETDVFRDKAEEPVIRTLTLFTNGPIYDFQLKADGGQQVTVFDLARNRFILLNQDREQKTTVTIQQVLESCARIKSLATREHDLFYFSANREFETSFEAATGWLTLSSKGMTYRIQGAKPADRSAVRRYQEFADWSARLNATLGLGLPPQARIIVDQQVAERTWIPELVERSITVGPSLLAKTHVARTRHLVNWQLSVTDRKRIDAVGNDLANFAAVDLFEFRRLGDTAQK